MKLTNYHTHTVYCDGKNTPEEMILEAIERGFDVLGFSGHSENPRGSEYSMTKEGTRKYFEEITALKEKYKNQIKILCGVEQDYFSPDVEHDFDYIIGSVHHIEMNGEDVVIDFSRQKLTDAADKHFGGDIYGLLEEYYRYVEQIVEKTNCDIIGHLDLVMKFNEDGTLFDEKHPRYVAMVEKTLNTLIKTGKVFEINTSAISRGYRSLPYPSDWIVKRIKELGGRVMITSDVHEKSNIDCEFDLARKVAIEAGFTEEEIITEL